MIQSTTNMPSLTILRLHLTIKYNHGKLQVSTFSQKCAIDLPKKRRREGPFGGFFVKKNYPHIENTSLLSKTFKKRTKLNSDLLLSGSCLSPVGKVFWLPFTFSRPGKTRKTQIVCSNIIQTMAERNDECEVESRKSHLGSNCETSALIIVARFHCLCSSTLHYGYFGRKFLTKFFIM